MDSKLRLLAVLALMTMLCACSDEPVGSEPQVSNDIEVSNTADTDNNTEEAKETIKDTDKEIEQEQPNNQVSQGTVQQPVQPQVPVQAPTQSQPVQQSSEPYVDPELVDKGNEHFQVDEYGILHFVEYENKTIRQIDQEGSISPFCEVVVQDAYNCYPYYHGEYQHIPDELKDRVVIQANTVDDIIANSLRFWIG